MKLSIIVPTFNEADRIRSCLAALEGLRASGHQVIVADGGSRDGTPDVAQGLADTVIHTARSRARQMNAGAALARGDVLVFVHADTRLPAQADELICQSLATTGQLWGRFDVAIEGTHRWFPVIGWCMNQRSRLTGIATGDQSIFVKRSLFRSCGGYPDIALMEDIALSRRLKTWGPPLCLKSRVRTSGRRWEQNGVLRTIVLMWCLRLAYFFGADPTDLARQYGYELDD